MKILFDETFTSNDGKRKSRNIWYGYAIYLLMVCMENPLSLLKILWIIYAKS